VLLAESATWPVPAILLVLILPGYALTMALLPGVDKWDRSERVLMSLGLSLAATALGGFAINGLPAGLDRSLWLIVLASLTLTACATAFWRRQLAHRNETEPADAMRHRPESEPSPALGVRVGSAAAYGLAALCVLTAFLLTNQSVVAQRQPSFTQLWMLPSEQAEANEIRIGVHSLQPDVLRYAVRVQSEGWLLLERQSIELRSGEIWQSTVQLPSGPLAGPVEAELYRLDAPETVYRRAIFWPRSAEG
jgi:hypothetical protein